MNKAAIGVLTVDDSSYMAQAFQHVLALLPGFELLGHAASRAEALALAARLTPALVVLDLRIPAEAGAPPDPEQGLATLQALFARHPTLSVLVLSSLPETPWLRLVAHAGALGFVSKDTSTEMLITALQAVASGLPAFTRAQLTLLRAPAQTALSPRERAVLLLLAEGASNQVIAERLGISIGTVRKHVERVCNVFGASSRGQAVAAARSQGVLS